MHPNRSTSLTPTRRADALFESYQQRIYRRTDRMFAVLMVIQWFGLMAAAYWISPLTWKGSVSQIHPHLALAIYMGGSLCALPVFLAWRLPGHVITRHTIGIVQVLFSGLLIHVTGGRLETHFHIFGSLAFLAIYRDWSVLIPATIIVAVDHFVRGVFWPESVFGLTTPDPWRWIEHAGWVLFEDAFLIIACRQGVADARRMAVQTAELEENSQWRNLIVEASPDAVITIDNLGNVIEWNRAASTLFGWNVDEAVGHTLSTMILPPRYRSIISEQIAAPTTSMSKPTMNTQAEIECVDKDGNEFPVEIEVTPIPVEGGTRFCVFIHDVRASRHAEQVLREAKESAEHANQAKSDFLANMSHEIRTPLNGILGFTELLLRSPGRDVETQRGFLQTIHSSGAHLLKLINDILDLSKIEAGQFVIEKEQCSPHRIITEAVSVLRARAQEKGLSLDYTWTTKVPETIETDPNRLRQLLTNLIGNSIKFTERGSIRIIAAWRADKERSELHLEVADNGIGIHEEHLESIFEPFVQGDNSVTRHYGGTGLGLAICRKIARRLGGDVTVKSIVCVGSVFSVTIDAGPANCIRLLDKPQVDLDTDRVNHAVLVQGHLNGQRILVVDDGKTNRDYVRFVLEEAGASVETAENGKEAIEVVSQRSFDAIIMDMQMPVLDGYSATRAIRSNGITTPILALTASAMAGDEAKCRQAGCSGYLSKPVEVANLLRIVSNAIGCTTSLGDIVLTSHQKGAVSAIDGPLYPSISVKNDTIRAIIQEFLDEIDERIEEISLAVEEENLAQVNALAHKLKGCSGSAGYVPMAKCCAELQAATASGKEGRLMKALRELRNIASRLALPDATSASPSRVYEELSETTHS